ncbi:hypothetical protein [Frateuria defendens]|uniref:hypothetical protein n=1 Tax=Frateuria defendens TaxID=2219559 RepID=UPI00066FCD49|nr:hypothetical protein [Frateuria defendens]
MRKFIFAASLAVSGALLLGACSQQDESQQASTQVQKAAKPTDPNDTKAWNAYLGQIVQQNMQGMTADRPFAYLVPAGDTDDAKANRDRQLSSVQDVIARGVLPGNMLVFAGPESAKTADFVAEAFKDAKPGSFKDVIVLFIGDAGDKDRVTGMLQPTGAQVRFVAM